ncbi:permease-like cell division protein FtsX [Solicola gregarius]|uniref:Cell division protein FtsX n=1 Tax=Solicola gregarius TaxID=2908642 RepID=A0AA46TFA4_9ACTN|nr:permease-like cell division protein FtsX [Solicola gregarius]UYM04085.1 permease-like cell division protein FtsX [Solicola gregarius]
MAFTQVFSELGTNLRRNVSMSVSLIVTMTVSLLLASLGLLLQQQADHTEERFGNELQVQVVLCTENSRSSNCLGGAATDEQADAVKKALDDNPAVESVEFRSSEEFLDILRETYKQGDEIDDEILEGLNAKDFPASYFVTMNDPDDHKEVESQVEGMNGVASTENLRDLLGPLFSILDYIRWAAIGVALLLVIAAVLQVSNTIRMTVYARRREIGIMRLVGASTWHIQMPFILESLVAALVSAALACAGLAAFMKFIVYAQAREKLSEMTLWVDWSDAGTVALYTLGFAILLALIPTLFMTRKYLKV